MTRHLVLLLAATWPFCGMAQEPAKPKAVTTTDRDFAILEAVLKDILSRGGRDSYFLNQKELFLSLEKPGDHLNVSLVTDEQRLKQYHNFPAAHFTLALEAATDLVRRQNLNAPFKDFKPNDKRIIIWEKEPRAKDKDSPLSFLHAQILNVFAPGFSKDEEFAVMYLTYRSGVHPGCARYGLARKDGNWVVVFRDLRFSL